MIEPEASVIPLIMVDSLVRTGFKDLSLLRHRLVDAETRSSTEPDLPVLDLQGNFLELASTNLNNDFQHQCFEVAVGRLGASHLPRRAEDISPHVFGIPGIPKCYGPPALYTFPPLCTFPTSTYLMPLNPVPYVPVLYTYCCSPRLILIT